MPKERLRGECGSVISLFSHARWAALPVKTCAVELEVNILK